MSVVAIHAPGPKLMSWETIVSTDGSIYMVTLDTTAGVFAFTDFSAGKVMSIITLLDSDSLLRGH